MKKIETPFEGLFVLETINFIDGRGAFQKLFNRDFFVENALDSEFCEFYFSVNKKGVIRGMHFQLPPHEHTKLVYVSQGRIFDVVIDLRKTSKTYKQHFSIELNASKGQYLYIPTGFAHGFASLEEDSVLSNSCGIEWPFESPIVSGRDLTFEKLNDFKSPF